MTPEGLDCWDDFPYEHGCICGNECDPPGWMIEPWEQEKTTEGFMGQPVMNPNFKP